MPWIKENCISFFQLFCIQILKIGRLPQHVAFILDGNRRYARKFNEKPISEHIKGFDKLTETMKWCSELGIREATVYAFSIENFKRTEGKVNGLMDLFRNKFQGILDDIDGLNKTGMRIHVVGRLSLLPRDLRALISKSMLETRHNNKLRLNIAIAYTGRDEISRAASHIVDGVKNKELTPNDINEDLISQTLELGAPELLVRTSGDARLSDFMLWQVSNTVLYFTDVLWPEFTIWKLLTALIHFKRNAPPTKEPETNSDEKKKFLDKLEGNRWLEIENFADL